MKILNQVIDEIKEGVKVEDYDNKLEVAKVARQKARISCRDLGAVLGLGIGQIMDIEQGRLDVSDDVIMAWVMVCASKLIVKGEMKGGG